MGIWSGYFFGEEDEINVKKLQAIIGIESYDEAKKVYVELKTKYSVKVDRD